MVYFECIFILPFIVCKQPWKQKFPGPHKSPNHKHGKKTHFHRQSKYQNFKIIKALERKCKLLLRVPLITACQFSSVTFLAMTKGKEGSCVSAEKVISTLQRFIDHIACHYSKRSKQISPFYFKCK